MGGRRATGSQVAPSSVLLRTQDTLLRVAPSQAKTEIRRRTVNRGVVCPEGSKTEIRRVQGMASPREKALIHVRYEAARERLIVTRDPRSGRENWQPSTSWLNGH